MNRKIEAIKTLYRKAVPKPIRMKAEIYRYRIITDRYLKTIDIENNMPLFKYIEIETINRCNGTCEFCPVNANQPQRPYAKMSQELFEKIIGELESMDYDGEFNLFSNNEPFLDKRILDWMKYGKEHLPKARLIMYTNGSLLTMEKFLETIKYTHRLVIDNYNNTPDKDKVNDNLKEIYEYIKEHHELDNMIQFALRDRQEELTSRGGQAPNKLHIKGIDAACFYPYKQMVIRPDGRCSLCACDALGKYTFGNVNEEKLIDIWNNDKYKKFRKEMLNNRRKNLELCRECDFHSLV